MAETYFVTGRKEINFEGVVSVTDLHVTMDHWFREKGFDKFEVKVEEVVTKDGKYIEWLFEPWKKVTDYIKLIVRIHVRMYNIVEMMVEIDGHPVKMNKGKINIMTEGFMVTDYEDRFDHQPLYYFIRTLYDKFFFRSYTQKYQAQLNADTEELRAHIKSTLNLYRFKIER